MDDPDDLGVETRPQRFARAQRDGEVFEACRFGDRVSTCYHNPRCSHEVPGFGRFLPAICGGSAEVAACEMSPVCRAHPLCSRVETQRAELGPCHICSGEADGECAICDRPVCDEDAAHKDHDRFCRSCAPGHP